jgi:hypothetical protein
LLVEDTVVAVPPFSVLPAPVTEYEYWVVPVGEKVTGVGVPLRGIHRGEGVKEMVDGLMLRV